MAVKHWQTAGIKFGVRRYSNTQLKALLDVREPMSPERMPPLQRNRMISKKATARRYVAFTPADKNSMKFHFYLKGKRKE